MLRIYSEQLSQNLSKNLASIYLLAGNDSLLLVECEDRIMQSAIAQGFEEKSHITLDNTTNWEDIFEKVQSRGLFFTRQVLNLRCPENINANLQKQLLTLIESLNSDVLLILQCPKLTKAQEKQKWFMAFVAQNSANTVVNCQTPTPLNLPKWLHHRAYQMQLSLDDEACDLLCYSYENNLLALKQALQLLSLLHADGKLTRARVKAVVEQSSVFSVFQWTDALLAGDSARAVHILQILRQEDVQAVILLRMLQRELLQLLTLTQVANCPNIDVPLSLQAMEQNFEKLKVWQNRRTLYRQAVKRLTYRQLFLFIQELAELERETKQFFNANIWTSLRLFSGKFCQS